MHINIFIVIAICWFGCGILSFGASVAYFKNKYPTVEYTREDYLESLFLSLAGLFCLSIFIANKDMLRFKYGWTIRPWRDRKLDEEGDKTKIKRVELALDGETIHNCDFWFSGKHNDSSEVILELNSSNEYRYTIPCKKHLSLFLKTGGWKVLEC